MKSDLTCPVEITKVTVSRETEHAKESEQVVCLIEFFNLSHKTIDSLQMNIVCFDADDTRLGGRLVRAAAPGAPRERFSGTFMPEHVDGAVRVEAAVEKVWFQDGVVWRREERNVREYTPNALPEGRELDRLRAVAGADAAGFLRPTRTILIPPAARGAGASTAAGAGVFLRGAGTARTEVFFDGVAAGVGLGKGLDAGTLGWAGAEWTGFLLAASKLNLGLGNGREVLVNSVNLPKWHTRQISAHFSLSSVTKDSAVPTSPARPVRPMRWM